MHSPSWSRSFASLLAFALALASFLGASVADAKVACAQLCSVPTRVVGSASGGVGEVRATLHDVADVPLAHQPFTLDFSQTSFRLFETQDPGVTVDCAERTITGMTNGYGEVVFHARFAGSDPSPALLLSSDGVNLGRVVGRSTDLDGQGGGTGLLDFAAFAAGFASTVPNVSLNFDGSASEVPDLVDFALFARELAAAARVPYCP
jgi:hypothetical protein